MTATQPHLRAVDSTPLTDLQQAIRAALAHERAASNHEDKYEQQMKSAGASMYAAFTAALRGCDEFTGRQISERTILNVYQSPKPRPWWDRELAAGGVERESAARLIQWHVDPDAARARRAKHVLAAAVARKKLTDQRSTMARGARAPREVSRKEADAVRAAGRGAEVDQDEGNAALRDAGRAKVLALIGRLQSKARRVDMMALADAIDVLEAVERDFDEALAQ